MNAPLNVNNCGECCMCCKVMVVEELEKPAGRWCSSCIPGDGCTRYATRPKSCAEFECVWLQSQRTDAFMGPAMRPDRSKVVLVPGTDNTTLVAHVDPGYPDAWRSGPMAAFLRSLISKGHPVVIACGVRRKGFNMDRQPAAVAANPILQEASNG